MVGEGWGYGELMAMPARTFMFWFSEQELVWKARKEAAKKPA